MPYAANLSLQLMVDAYEFDIAGTFLRREGLKTRIIDKHFPNHRLAAVSSREDGLSFPLLP